ncbi:phosphoglycerate mutase family protein [Drechmeria coniospora]|uniref:Phosphoglycerate mutase family protein n=1 Tax=Drechmeria coniospora TaxID=98403 RepID=A0A151GD67_DRECN|nr:phosphoglycerate mutase family protein [Drechmeria coniospora]KYK55004.1 phosphoglycerate mutase family protein [Drechmeria coniospora]ODA82366.1 hypothetical protein RJ55_00873 [Drechmeria coniospora]
MAPTIHLVRHAQGVHNLSVENESIRDPDLTTLGSSQCADLRTAFPYHDLVTRLVASPLRRTLATCVAAFGHDSLYPIVALDVLQEVSDSPCDTGSSTQRLLDEFGGRVDLARVSDGWTEKGAGSVFEPTLEKIAERARESRTALRALAGSGDDHVVVVSHGGMLHFLTDDWQGIPNGRATGWDNCEYRSYQFADPSGADDEAALVETEESWRRRKLSTKPPSPTEQRELRAVMQDRVAPYLKIKA